MKKEKIYSLEEILEDNSFEQILNELISSGATEEEINKSLEKLF